MNATSFPRKTPIVVSLLCVAGLFTSGLWAQEDAGPPSDLDAGTDAATSLPADPRVAQIRALLDGTLDVSVDPSSLFDVSLDDDAAIRLEIVRLEALLRAADEATRPPPPKKPVRKSENPPDAGGLLEDIQALGVDVWATRLELDRTRLEYYVLSAERRREILDTHKERQEAAKPKETEAERLAREAEVERQKALEQARAARTEAERLVAEELARLIALETTITNRRAAFREERTRLSSRKDTVLGWQRRVRDAKANGEADATYDAIREALRASRIDLDGALEVLGRESSELPGLGPDALTKIPSDVATDHVALRRRDLEKALGEARQEEQALRRERREALIDEVTTLNRERLDLLPHLSNDKREAITGFTAAGWDQARSEGRHLSLLLRNQRHVGTTWFDAVRKNGWRGISSWQVIGTGLPWLMLALVFFWARRQIPTVLELAEKRFAEADRAERRTTPGSYRRFVQILTHVHRPLEWLILILAVKYFLPSATHDVLEVQLLLTALGWIFGGALVANSINALAMGNDSAAAIKDDPIAVLRLRSLKVVTRSIVVFALVLTISSGLVGAGTIYNWVWQTYWIVALPVFFLLVHWWRSTVFERTERARNKSALQKWVLANRAGWKSFLAATLGAVQLFVTGIAKTTRTWLSEFDLARRVHAYLFRRELDRLGENGKQARLRMLGTDKLTLLHPERECSTWVDNPADAVLEALAKRIAAKQGGVIIIVGSRGMGKTTLLRELKSRTEALDITCETSMDLERIKALTAEAANAVLIDDVHLLIKPVIGGLGVFDGLMTLARASSAKTTWILAMDASLWPFLKRARDGRPMFDETYVLESWTEAQIGTLLDLRSEDADIEPQYDDLLEVALNQVSEEDRLDAIEAKKAGYVRMLWDYARGNPAIALEVWRSSLGVSENEAIHVRPLQVPDTALLEALSDSSLFVLRAIIQLSPAAPEDIARATRLGPEQVLNALRYGQAQGFIAETDGRVRISWSWVRAVMRILERRHLLVMS